MRSRSVLVSVPGVKPRARFRAVAASVAVGAVASFASAQATAPEFEAITFPVDMTSLVAGIAAAGATVFLVSVGVPIAFKFLHRVKQRITKGAG